jgi:hypothetical protein
MSILKNAVQLMHYLNNHRTKNPKKNNIVLKDNI